MFSVYIIWSDKLRKYYVGHTDDLQRRIFEHNTSRTVFTKIGMPWKLVYREECGTRSNAMKREHDIKLRKSRKYIERLISGQSLPSSS